MDKQNLRKLTKKYKELKCLVDRIESVGIYPCNELTGMPRGCMTSDKTATTACVLADYRQQLKAIMMEIEQIKKEIQVDEIICKVLYLRVVSNMSWRQVSDIVGGSGETLRKKYHNL